MQQWVSELGALAALTTMAVFIVRFVLGKVWSLVERQQLFMENHLTHNTAALIELKAAVRELRESLAIGAESRRPAGL